MQMSLPSAPAADSNGLFLLLPELGLSDKFCSTKVDETVDPLDDEEGIFLVLRGSFQNGALSFSVIMMFTIYDVYLQRVKTWRLGQLVLLLLLLLVYV